MGRPLNWWGMTAIMFLCLTGFQCITSAQEPEARVVDFATQTPPAGWFIASYATIQKSCEKSVLHVAGSAITNQWNEFINTLPGYLAPREAYDVTVTYKLVNVPLKSRAYMLFRRQNNPNNSMGWQDLAGEIGVTSQMTAKCWTGDHDDFCLILGMEHGVEIEIEKIEFNVNPSERMVERPLPPLKLTWKSPGGCTYYVDSQAGDNAWDGRSEKYPWRTLEKVNTGEFAAGDTILLKADSVWQGYLTPGGKGVEGNPIRVGVYGDGPRPQINGMGEWKTVLYLFNVEQIEVIGLEISNSGSRQAGRCGVLVELKDFGIAHHIHLNDLYVHDVTGSLVKDEGGGAGINCVTSGEKTPSRYDDLKIENCHLERTDRNGIIMFGEWTREKWNPNTNVVIRGNLLEDIGGDGIVPIACDGAVVEYNILRGGRMRCNDYAAGIWPWSCDNTIIQFNEVSGMKGTMDGQGFDSDWNCNNTTIQYNYSHDNEGGFCLVCNDGNTKMPWNAGNNNTIIRYNLSQNDGDKTFNISGPCKNTKIYNNTIYIGSGLKMPIITGGNWGGAWPEETLIANNIFYSAGQTWFDFKEMINIRFENNIFYGDITSLPAGENNIIADPQFIAPGTGATGVDSLSGYQLQPTSPGIAAGLSLDNNGGRDLTGTELPTTCKPDIGAMQSH